MKINNLGYCILFIVFLISSCSPVHRFTKVQRVPREYTMNYCMEPIKAAKSEWAKEPWLVFSDRDNNATTALPGGKLKKEQANFLDCFIVIGEQGDFLKLIKHTPEVKNGYLMKKYKEVEFAGWLHKSKLLLTRQSLTSLATGFKNKHITVITDTLALLKSKDYLVTDGIKTFKDNSLTIPNSEVKWNEIVYVLKTSPDNRKTLITKKTVVSADEAKTEVLGWVPSSMLQSLGDRQFAKQRTVPRESLRINRKGMYGSLTRLSTEQYKESEEVNENIGGIFSYNPMINYNNCDTVSTFKTGFPLRIIDKSDNYVFNINGKTIDYNEYRALDKKLKEINVVLVIQGEKHTINNFSSIVNTVQQLQSLFENNEDKYKYGFGSVIAMQEDSAKYFSSIGIVDNYPEMLTFLSRKIGSDFKPVTEKERWRGLDQALNMLEKKQNATNLLVVIGETGSDNNEIQDTSLISKLADLNCRILGFQTYSDESSAYNNFVLQISDMIEKSAPRIARNKTDNLVFAKQLKPAGNFVEVEKNAYRLDFPENSMSQGWVVFPEKQRTSSLELLGNSVDSLITEIKLDNENVLTNLEHAFNTVGSNHDKYHELFLLHNNLTNPINKEFTSKFSEKTPLYYLSTYTAHAPQSATKLMDWCLMLSKDELEDVKSFVGELSDNEVDYQSIEVLEEKKQKSKKLCNCPDDDFDPLDKEENDSTFQYADTKPIRDALFKTYMSSLKTCDYCKINKKQLKKITLSEAHEKIIGIPSRSELLRKYTVDDLNKPWILNDAMLEKLVEYFMEKKDILEKQTEGVTAFESNGEAYYWVEQKALP